MAFQTLVIRSQFLILANQSFIRVSHESPSKVAMKGATFEQNEEVAQALIDLLHQGKSKEDVLEMRRVMIQKWLQDQCEPMVTRNQDGTRSSEFNADAFPAGVP